MSYAFVFDPWQLFHQPWFRDPVFIRNARFQNAGIINSYDFDSVVLGSSMAENFSAKEASELLGGTFVNLSMAGSLLSERYIVLKRLFNKKVVSNVIVSLDHSPYIPVGKYSEDMPPGKYDFLYNANPFDDFRIYFDVNLFSCWDVKANCRNVIPGERSESLEGLYSWFPYYVKAFGGIQAWCYWSTVSPPFRAFLKEIISVQKAVENGNTIPGSKTFVAECQQNSNATFDTYLLSIIKENPETTFLLFIPPYSRLWYGTMAQYYTGYYQAYLLFIEHMVRATSPYPNALVFGFDDMDFTGDLANYKDQSHYHKNINSKILQLMAQRSHLISEDSLDEYLIRITELAANYDLKKISTEFEACLNK